ncbi:hypothetical protein KO481_29280 [Nocardia sp. NEAU-G5]|uniref:Carboxymuconolactone decarboxylase-like domain-containing protein n=1 Tax=Nocardia albiluteola TaxID=2842303 RepID=A0ABS6B5L2_9NOCA|nr:hypothetical protein [Nocardia albiluteola]MBU3062559.1 hypothetical protein [Nocardia albiluteola]MBU3065607.1 hypothetical protein [Nocardia albiluteola]
MRIEALERGHDLAGRWTLRTMRALGRMEVPDVIKVMFYRHRYFGTPFSDLLQDLMRGPSEWTIGERELFATFTSARNQCEFCRTCHQVVAESYQPRELVIRALERPADSGQRPEVVAVLDFLEKLAESPDDVEPDDVDRVRRAGVTDTALEQAIRISAAFHVINRIMDTVGGIPPRGRQLPMTRWVLRRLGYTTFPTVKYLSFAR